MTSLAPLLRLRAREGSRVRDPLGAVPRPPALLQLPVQVVVRGQERDVLRERRAPKRGTPRDRLPPRRRVFPPLLPTPVIIIVVVVDDDI